MRRLWTEDHVTHDGDRFHVQDVTLRPKPVQEPIEVWLGGQAPSELRRVGRLGDGWLPSFCTVADVEDGWATISASAAEHGRTIDPEHLGALVAYTDGEIPGALRRAAGGPATRARPGRSCSRSGSTGSAAGSRTSSPSARRSSWCCRSTEPATTGRPSWPPSPTRCSTS